MTQSLDNLVDELGIEEMTYARYASERARLARTLHLKYGWPAIEEEIDAIIRSGAVHTDEVVEAWINLTALEPYIQRDSRPPKPKQVSRSAAGAAKAALAVFGCKISLFRRR